jgi:hypothetical protein
MVDFDMGKADTTISRIKHATAGDAHGRETNALTDTPPLFSLRLLSAYDKTVMRLLYLRLCDDLKTLNL